VRKFKFCASPLVKRYPGWNCTLVCHQMYNNLSLNTRYL